ncbi:MULTISPECIES: TetR/AcrR family transcriptional regulator [Mycobacteriaceae]|uniref:TetR/AcrR family transcriptional regulator n=2 Tax=Mycolicibacterium pallens TaxID=370524 RepID=A0ABX8VPA5_9MYCO|nr:TetR/AcrR family transcriptional regulator [Mycolicibacterium pallens]
MTRTPTTDRRSKGSTRTKMLVAAAEVLRERGAAGVTIDEVLARSGAPRGSVYHHFPEGRGQILREALEYAGYVITESIDEAACENASVLLRRFVELWENALITSDYTAGCPVLAAAVGSGEDEHQLTAAAGEIFSRWRDASKQAYLREGFDDADASALADTTLAAMEGAVVLCRSVRSLQPLHSVAAQIEFLIKAKEFVTKFGVPTLNP